MSLPSTSCCFNGVSYVVYVVSGCCGLCLEKNLKCRLVVTQGDCKRSHKIFYFLLLMVFSGDCVNKQKLSLQKKLDKARTKDAELQAEKLVLMEKISGLYEERHVLFSREFCLRKQLGFLSKKKKKMFARELASIEDLKRSKQGASESVGLLDACYGCCEITSADLVRSN